MYSVTFLFKLDIEKNRYSYNDASCWKRGVGGNNGIAIQLETHDPQGSIFNEENYALSMHHLQFLIYLDRYTLSNKIS